MKKLLLAVLAMAFFIAPAFAEDDDFIVVKVDGNIFLQGGGFSNQKDYKPRYEKGNNALYTAAVNLSKEFSNGGKAVLNIKGGNGSQGNVFGWNDATTDTKSSLLRVTEFSYQQPILNNWASVKFGRIGTIGGENNLAGSADTQFVNPVFTGEATKIGPNNYDEGDAYGLQVSISPASFLDVAYEYAVSGDANKASLDGKGWNAIQLTLKPSETGNYRIAYWRSSDLRDRYDYDAKEFDTTAEGKGPAGFSVSIDQAIISWLSVFARYGQVVDKESLATINADDGETYFQPERAVSLGFQFDGSLWSRDNDTLGLAAGDMIFPKAKNKNGNFVTPFRVFGEVYYKIAINEFIAISPAVQYSKYFKDRDLDFSFAYILRTHLSF